MQIPDLPPDKAKHVVYGAALGLVGALMAYAVDLPAWACSLALSSLFGAAKEIYDAAGYGTADLMDALATVAGAMPCAIVAAIVQA